MLPGGKRQAGAGGVQGVGQGSGQEDGADRLDPVQESLPAGEEAVSQAAGLVDGGLDDHSVGPPGLAAAVVGDTVLVSAFGAFEPPAADAVTGHLGLLGLGVGWAALRQYCQGLSRSVNGFLSEVLDSPLSVVGGSGDPADWVPAGAGGRWLWVRPGLGE